MGYGFSTLKVGTFLRWRGCNKTATIADIRPSATEEMENRLLSNIDVGATGGYPFTVDFMKRSVRNQSLVWATVFGDERYPGRDASLDSLLIKNVESPEIFAVPFWASIWGRMAINYARKVTEGVRRLT